MEKIKQIGIALITIAFANFCFGFAVVAFVKPHGIIMGGATGLALALEHYFNTDLSVTLAIINIILYIFGIFFLGKKFAVTTFLTTFLYPAFVGLFSKFPIFATLTDDMLLSAILGSLCLGAGMGLLIRMGASSGGMDIPALIFNKVFHIPVAVTLYTCDTVILITQAGFSNSEQILYGIVFTLLCSIIVNKVLLAGSQRTQLFIISDKSNEIKKLLLQDINVGATLIQIEKAMTGEPQKAVLCVTTNRMAHSVQLAVQKLDPSAFITLSVINEVKGRGFSIKRDAKVPQFPETPNFD